MANDSNHQFSRKISYLNTVSNRPRRVPLYELNYEHKFSIIYGIKLKKQFLCKNYKK